MTTKESPKKTTKKTAKKEEPKVSKRMVPELEKRQPKKVDRFEIAAPEKKEAKVIVVPKGKGRKLEDCPHILASLNKRRSSDEALIALHGVVLGKVTKAVKVKANLKQFSGVVYDDDKNREKLEDKLHKLHMNSLREVARLVGVLSTGDKDDLVARLCDWAEKPHDADEAIESPKKRKRSDSPTPTRSRSRSKSPAKRTKRAKKDPNAPKKPLSAFMFFCKDKRPEVVKEHPKEGVTDIAKHLGKAWKKITATEKKKFEAMAEKDKARYAKDMKKYKPEK